jgi:hypothetical protein
MTYQCFPNDGLRRRWHGRHLFKLRVTMQPRLSQMRFCRRMLRLIAAFRGWAMRPARTKTFQINQFH